MSADPRRPRSHHAVLGLRITGGFLTGIELEPQQLVLQKAIARNNSPTALLDHLMREELRVQTEHRGQRTLRRAAIFPLTTIDARARRNHETRDHDPDTGAGSRCPQRECGTYHGC